MLHHEERPASALARGPAKCDDIERVRRDVGAAEASETPEPSVERALGEMEAACQTIRDDLGELKRAIGSERLPGTAQAQRGRDHGTP